MFGAPAVDGLGNAGGFKLMVEDLGDQPLDFLQGQSENLAAKGTQAAGNCRTVQQLSRERSAALYRYRPHQMQDDACVAQRRLQHAAGLPGRILRQRFQPLRPHLAGQSAGRCGVSPEGGGRATAQGAERRRRDGSAGNGRHDRRRRRADDDHALQHAHRGRPQRSGPAGRQLGHGDFAKSADWRKPNCRRA